MAQPRSRLVRRAPLMDRLKAYLDPWDFLLWLSEEINGNDWEDFQKSWTIPVGVALNVVFMIARANTGSTPRDDVFGDYYERAGSGWTLWLASFVVHTLALVSCVNATYTFLRKRHYRLFEAPIDATPSTTSAQRVRVESSPVSSSPLRFLSSIIATSTAEQRAHPDATRDVWELAVWDPTPLCLQLFCLFSPGHVLVYWLFLPVPSTDPRPSVTVVTAIALAVLLSVQMSFLQSSFSRQIKDTASIHKEVMHEYDTKYVHPALNKIVRDVSTQTFNTQASPNSIAEVYSYTPTTYVNRGFQVNPNPNYASHFDPDGLTKGKESPQRLSRSVTTPNLRASKDNNPVDFSSPLRPTPALAMRQPRFSLTPRASLGGDGGSFGIFNHARSPLRKSMGAAALDSSPAKAHDRSHVKRAGSPLKRSSTPGGLQTPHFAPPAGDGLRRERRPY